jgi:hypothetical protein
LSVRKRSHELALMIYTASEKFPKSETLPREAGFLLYRLTESLAC